MRYDPTRWYWAVAGVTDQVFSSAAQGFVPVADAGFAAWREAGGAPTPIDSADSLALVLRPYGLALSPPDPKAALVAYANGKQWTLATGGYTVTLGSQAVTIATDDDGRTAIAGKYLRMAQPNAPATIAWQVGPSTFVTIAAADFATLAVKVADFVQATFDALAVVLAAIAAGTITTTAQVDAAAWPAAAG